MARIPINIKEAKIENRELIVGIDLGTTNSLVAWINPETGEAQCVKEEGASALVPSLVYFDESGKAVVGTPARRHLVDHPTRTIYSVKRLMGKSYRDVKSQESFFGYNLQKEEGEKLVKIRVDDRYYSPIDLSAIILAELRSRAEKMLNASINKAVITVPAYFNDAQRQATRDAGKLAGLDVLRIINEPTAASLAYGLGLHRTGKAETEAQTIAVYDLGGGTFDISILRIHPDSAGGIFEVLSTHGDTFLGGDDFDQAIVDFWLQKNQRDPIQHHLDKSFSQLLRLIAEKAKIHLTDHTAFTGSHETLDCGITRAEFNSLAAPLVQRTMNNVHQALHDARLEPSEIECIVMVGGSTRMPLVKSTVASFFGRPVYDQLNPDEVVALGAAIQADVLAGRQKEVLLLDVTPLSLGIETMGELMDVIIPRNSKIPTRASRQYTTSKDGQSKLKIGVYQGERDVVRDNRKLAEFMLSGIPAMPAGLPKIEIRFVLNADGILKVNAREQRSGLEQEIEVKPQYGLTDEEVESMLKMSIEHAAEDVHTRGLLEAREEAQQVIQATHKFLKLHADLLSEPEQDGIRERLAALEAVSMKQDKDLIHSRLDALNEYTAPYAHRAMDVAVSDAMKGKKV